MITKKHSMDNAMLLALLLLLSPVLTSSQYLTLVVFYKVQDAFNPDSKFVYVVLHSVWALWTLNILFSCATVKKQIFVSQDPSWGDAIIVISRQIVKIWFRKTLKICLKRLCYLYTSDGNILWIVLRINKIEHSNRERTWRCSDRQNVISFKV